MMSPNEQKEAAMDYLVVFICGAIVGFVAGALVYRSNARALETQILDLTAKIKKSEGK